MLVCHGTLETARFPQSVVAALQRKANKADVDVAMEAMQLAVDAKASRG